MKKAMIGIKLVACISLIVAGLIGLTNLRLNGLKIFDWSISPDTVNALIDTAGDYLFWIYVVLIVFIFFKKKIKK